MIAKLVFLFVAAPVVPTVFGINVPSLNYAFSIYNAGDQGVSAPVVLAGYNQTSGVASNSTIVGPLLNAISVSENFAEQIFPVIAGTNVSYSTSTASIVYVTDEGESFAFSQTGIANAKSDIAVFTLSGIGGKYAALRQYQFVCYTPLTFGSSFNNTQPSSTASAAGAQPSSALNEPSNSPHADCFVVGQL